MKPFFLALSAGTVLAGAIHGQSPTARPFTAFAPSGLPGSGAAYAGSAYTGPTSAPSPVSAYRPATGYVPPKAISYPSAQPSGTYSPYGATTAPSNFTPAIGPLRQSAPVMEFAGPPPAISPTAPMRMPGQNRFVVDGEPNFVLPPTLPTPTQVPGGSFVPAQGPTISAPPAYQPLPTAQSYPQETIVSSAPAHTMYPAPMSSASQAPFTTQVLGGCDASTGCHPLCCDGVCGPYGRTWVAAEYLYWVGRGQHVPSLITSAPAGTPRATAGTLGDPNTTTVFGNQNLNNDFRSGFRVRGGFWLDECQTRGIDGSLFFLGQSRDRGFASSNGSPGLFRPFNNVRTGQPGAQLVAFQPATQLVAFPGVVAGSVQVDSTSDIWGGNLNYRHNLCCSPCGRLDLLLGYRYLRLADQVTIREDLIATNPNPGPGDAPFGTRFQVTDSFRTVNQFHGGQIGLAGEIRRGNWIIGGYGTVALGNTQTTVDINGATTITQPGQAPVTREGGLLAQRSNIGHYTFNDFTVVPEVGLTLGYQVNKNVRLYAGYNFLYWNQVGRAGDQIPTRVNDSQIPGVNGPGTLVGPNEPQFRYRSNDYWLQGALVGLQINF